MEHLQGISILSELRDIHEKSSLQKCPFFFFLAVKGPLANSCQEFSVTSLNFDAM